MSYNWGATATRDNVSFTIPKAQLSDTEIRIFRSGHRNCANSNKEYSLEAVVQLTTKSITAANSSVVSGGNYNTLATNKFISLSVYSY